MKFDSKQQVFDFVVRGLVAQGGPSLAPLPGPDDPGFRCMYRGVGGRKCAVGLLIEDANYHAALEGECATSDAVRAALGEEFWAGLGYPDRDGDVVAMLEVLQEEHDSIFNRVARGPGGESDWAPRALANALRLVAAGFGVSAAVVDELLPT